MRRLLAIRDARIFLFGWSLSSFGDSAMFLVLGIWAKDLTGSNAAAGLVFFVLTLPSFLAPIAGLWVDRLKPTAAADRGVLAGRARRAVTAIRARPG